MCNTGLIGRNFFEAHLYIQVAVCTVDLQISCDLAFRRMSKYKAIGRDLEGCISIGVKHKIPEAAVQ